MTHSASSSQETPFRIFLSHAGEDKETIARPLYERLRKHDVSVFLDNESFRLGDDCPKVMENAMQNAPVGVFIMSPEFVAKKWPMRELMAFAKRYDTADKETRPLLIPVFYRFSTRECRDPTIFDTHSSLFRQWGLLKRLFDGDVSLEDVKHALDTAATVWSIENNSGANNSDSPNMGATRECFLQIIENSILERLGIEKPQLVDEGHPVVGYQPAQQDVYTWCNMVPPNPPRLTLDYSSPITCEGRLKCAVLSSSGSRIVAIVASGKGGVGKTCAMRGLAEDSEIKRVFSGGILYIQLGNDAAVGNIIEEIANIVDCTGGSKLASVIKNTKSVQKACHKAAKWFRVHSCLFLVDDVWHANGIDSDVLTTLGIMMNTKSRMVYTSRDNHFLVRANEVIEFREKETFGDLSQQMLMAHAGLEEDTVLDAKNKEAIKYFLTMCQGLPLGLGIVGGAVRRYSFTSSPKENAWSDFHEDLCLQQKDLMEAEAETYGTLPKIVDISLQVLEKRGGDGKFGYWFRALCVLQKQQSVPVKVLQKLWDFDTLQETRSVVESFADVSVVQMSRINGTIYVQLHDLILEIAARKAREASETESFFQILVCNYMPYEDKHEGNVSMISAQGRAPKRFRYSKLGASKRDTTGPKLCQAWWNAEDDGYIHNNLCRLLRKAGYGDELLWLLSQPQWIVKRLVEGGIVSVEQDLDHGKATCSDSAARNGNHREHLQMVGRAARMGASFVSKNRRVEEGWFQVHGRLLWHARRNELTRDFVERMERSAPKPWLKASEGVLEQAGGGALQVINVEGSVLCTRVEPDAIWILSRDDDDIIHVKKYDTVNEIDKEEEWLRHPEPSIGRVESASFLADQRRVVTAHYDGRICVWNRQTGVCEEVVIHDCANHGRFVNFCMDGLRLACETGDHTIQLWDTLSGNAVGQPLRGHTGGVSCVALSADGTRIVSGSSDETVRVWDSESGNAVRQPLRGHTGRVSCVALSADGTRIVSGSSDNTVRVWDAESGNAVGQPLRGHTGRVSCVALSADGTRIVSGSRDETVRVWDAESGNAVGQPLRGHTGWVYCVALSADGTRIVSGSGFWDETVRVWDAESGNAVGQPLQGHTGWVYCVALSADGTRIVSGSSDKTVRVWDAESGNAVGQPLRGHTREVSCVALSADGTRIVSGSSDETVRVWDAESGNAVGQPLRGHTREVYCVALSADGTRIVSGSSDETVRVWDAEGGNAVGQPLRGHADEVNCVALSADGTRILSGSWDETVRVWDAESGAAVRQPLQGHTGGVQRVAISADGSLVVSADKEMQRLWVLSGGGRGRVRTSRDAAWKRTLDALELTWSRREWEPSQREVREVAEDGSEIVLGSCVHVLDNVGGGDVYFTDHFRSCRIVR